MQSETSKSLRRNKLFDPLMGTIGGLFMGSIVYAVNASYGFDAAIIAALKQGGYTFFMGGITMKLAENLSVKFPNTAKALSLATTLPTLLAVSLTYLLHSLKGTPEPLTSTLPTLLLAPGGFLWWAHKKRKTKILQEDNKHII
ncbi:hypothetical protein DMA11_16515 [Marinilabiliaceae bacterium JC017]|nr:hypothetical protein DMA11_16515 [Marinilabiliaceae bacterium JC017]